MWYVLLWLDRLLHWFSMELLLQLLVCLLPLLGLLLLLFSSDSLAATAAFVIVSPAISAVATLSLAAAAASAPVVVAVATGALAIALSPAAALVAAVSWQLLFLGHLAGESELSPSPLFSPPQSTPHWRPS